MVIKTHPQLQRIQIKKNKVYIDKKLQKNIDGATCKIIFPTLKENDFFDGIYFQDKNTVYFLNLLIYKSQKSKTQTVVRKVTSDLAHFTVIDEGLLSKDTEHVYLLGRPIEGADAQTFVLITSHNFAQDKNHVYYYANYEPYFMTLLYADPKTFIPFTDNHGNYTGFGSDKDNLYADWRLANDQKWDWYAHGLNQRPMFKDGKMLVTEFKKTDERVYDFIQAHKNMNGYWWSTDYQKKPQDCKPLGRFHYAKNALAVYTMHKSYGTPELVQGADPKTFEPLTEQFSRDEDCVFFYGDKILGVDPKTVRILPGNKPPYSIVYIADAYHVFCITEKYNSFYSFEIKGSDPKTFKIIDDVWTKDKNYTYKKGIISKK